MPSTIEYLSKKRTKHIFPDIPKYEHAKSWERAKYLQDFIYQCPTTKKYLFKNRRYVQQDIKKITKSLIEKHTKAFTSNTYKSFIKDRVLYVYNHESKICECNSFWHYKYCKHQLAIMIYN